MNTDNKTITMAHGSGGMGSAWLMREVFGRHFSNEILDRLEDAAVVSATGAGSIVVSTDSFVVTPAVFPGGDIGKLAVCGTVNDVLMMGAVPRYMTCGFILEEGLDIDLLDRICASMAQAASKAGVTIVAGDTKVIERRHTVSSHESSQSDADANEPTLLINTTGIGFFHGDTESGKIFRPSADAAQHGDAVIVSGTLGDHHACILSARLSLTNGIQSDCAVLNDIVNALYDENIETHVLRDVTRGGLGTVLNEIANSSAVSIEIDADSIPVMEEVKAFCGIMGLDPLYMGNEGKLVAIVAGEDAERALAAIKRTKNGADAKIIGCVIGVSASQNGARDSAPSAAKDGTMSISDITSKDASLVPLRSSAAASVIVKTRIGGARRLPVLQGEGLPRIC